MENENLSMKFYLQILGYFIAFHIDPLSPPLVFILSEEDIQLVLVPFQGEGKSLLIAVVLPKLRKEVCWTLISC